MHDIPMFSQHLIFFDQVRFKASLDTGPKVDAFKDAIEGVNRQFNQRFLEGENIRRLVVERALFIDCLLHYAWHAQAWGGLTSLVAVGGYGRKELHPKSDVDLLILLDTAFTANHLIEDFLTLLWDIGLDIGHSVRTFDQCIALAKEDVTVFTNLLEARHLQGNTALTTTLKTAINDHSLWTKERFFKAKLQEQTLRHQKHNNTEYNLEPNVKNAPGGLRDIQTIKWLIKQTYGVSNIAELQGSDIFTDGEYGILVGGEEFLWKVRYGLHMVTERTEERLLFDYQKELCAIFGYKDNQEQLAIEQFMQVYYRVVLALRELNDVLLQFLDETMVNRGDNHTITPVNERFQLRNRYLEVTHLSVFKETPSALLELFVITGRDASIEGVRASTIRLIRESRELIDDRFRENPVNNALFIELLTAPYRLEQRLKRMLRYGILGRYLPEFGRITGQMQHDLFHRYTVDAHTLKLIKFIDTFKEGEGDFPIAHDIIKQLPNITLLYIAGLYHDIAKGRGGDHSLLGSVDAYDFCHRHKLTNRDTRLVSWLVENHLLMSSYSQKQDLSDPEVIHNFAMLVGDQNHLNYLYLLTVADMNATNPDIWNSWRASLMRDLYYETRRALRRGLENPIDRQESIKETQQAAMYILTDNKILEADIKALWQDYDEDYFLREDAYDIAWQTTAILQHAHPEQPLIAIREKIQQGSQAATQLFLRVKEKDNIFAAVITALHHLHLNVQDARIYSTQKNYTMDTFYILDEDDNPVILTPQIIEHISETIKKELDLVDNYHDIIQRRLPRELKYFNAPTRTHMSTDIFNNYSILEVISPDRPGLLARLARIFVEFDITIINAKIITLGERVEDVFFITTDDGLPLIDLTLCNDLQRRICQTLDAQIQ